MPEMNKPCPLCGRDAWHYPFDHDNAVRIECGTCCKIIGTRTALRRIGPEAKKHLSAKASSAPEGYMLLIRRPSLADERAGVLFDSYFMPAAEFNVAMLSA